jgi:methyl-galactoside transport system substrate-binding protein
MSKLLNIGEQKMRKKILLAMMIIVMMITLFKVNNEIIFASENFTQRQSIKVAVLLQNFTDDYISLVRKNLEDIQKENPGKVQFTFYDGKSNQALQNEQLDKVLREGVNLILLHLINNKDQTIVQTVIEETKKYDIPVILFNREPITLDPIRSYKKSLYIGLDAKNDGIMQGQILVDAWNTNRESIDRNHDGIMQYVLLKGAPNNIVAEDRTKYSISTIKEAGIETKELASAFAYWDRGLAQSAMNSLFLKYDGNIEAVIANDDSMALGAIKALQAYGYNTGDKNKTIAVVGVEGLPEAQELVKSGKMLGTIFQDHKALADALYRVGVNLINSDNPLEGTTYKFDETGVAIRIPNSIIYKAQ